MKKAMIILFWYFMVIGNPPATEGPFGSKAQCDQLRDWVIKDTTIMAGGADASKIVSECWEVKNESR